MAKIRIKRSATPGKVPLLIDLDLGELSANTYDGKIFFKRDNGTESIVKVLTDIDISQDNTLGANLTSADIIPSQKAVQEAVALNSSTGLIHGGILSINSPTTFNISGGEGVITDTSNSGRQQVFVNWAGVNDITPTNLLTNNVTYIAINENGEVVQQTTEYTTAQHRTLIIIGVIIHVNFTTINNVNNTQHIVINPVNQLQDLAHSLGFINVNGNVYSSNGNNLKIDKSAGNLHGTGINYQNDDTNPNIKSTVSLSGLTFQYRKQDGISSANITDINPAIYDVNGVETTVPNGKFTIQRIHLFPSNGTRIQPGQHLYDSIAHAISNIQLEEFVTEDNIKSNSLLRAFLIVRSDATNLSDKTQAFFLEAGKFNSVVGVGGLSVSSLQDAYNNAPQAVITTTDTIGPVVVKRGSASDTDTVFEIHDGNDNVVFDIKGDGTSDSLDAIFDTKVDKVAGYALSKNDLTDELFGELSLQKYLRDEMESVVNVSGGIITPTGGITFSISPGVGYARDLTGKLVRVTWNTLTSSTINSGDNFINVDYAGNVVITSNSEQGDLIALGYISTALANTVIVGYSNARLIGKNHLFNIGEWLRSAVGTLVQAGCNTAMKPYPNELELTVGSGFIWTLLNRFTVTDKSTFTKLVKSSDYGFFVDSVTTANTVNTAYWNNTSNVAVSALVPMTPGYYKKDLIALTPEGTVFYIYANSEWATLDEAKSAPVPLVPDNIKLSVARSASLVSQEGATSVDTVIDIRPMISRLFDTGQAASNATIISHSDLIDLGADDHLLYHCFSEDTELLTIDGWKHHSELATGTLVYSYNMNTSKCEPDIIEEVFRYTNYDKIINIKNTNIDLMVTEDHGLVYKHRRRGTNKPISPNWLVNTAKTVSKMNRVFIPVASSSEYTKTTDPIKQAYYELYGWFIGDGSFVNSTICIWQNKGKKFDRILDVLAVLKLEYTIHEGKPAGTKVSIRGFDTVTSADYACIYINAESLKNSGFIFKKDLSCLIYDNDLCFESLLNGLILSDGHYNSKTSYTYYGKNTELLSQLQQLCVLNGYRSKFSYNANGVYRLTIAQTSTLDIQAKNATVLPYSGTVWCAKVKNRTLIVRRNGSPIICHNTDARGDVRYYRKSDIDLLLLGKANSVHGHVAGDISGLVPSSVGLGNVQNVNQTIASNITSGTLSNDRLTNNLKEIGNATFNANDIVQHNGGVLTGITVSNLKGQLQLNNVDNSLQVINAGNGVSFSSGPLVDRPIASVNGRLYATTNNGIFIDNGSSWVLQQAPISGDITISANSTVSTLATVNSNIGTFNNVTVNAKGLVTSASNVAYLSGNQNITLSGDFSGSGTTSITGTLATVNSNIGTFNNVTVNAKGLVTSASNVSYLTGNQSITVSGDLSGTGTTSIALTLATVNSNVGTFGSSNTVPIITTNAKGLITSVTTSTITPTSIGLGNVVNVDTTNASNITTGVLPLSVIPAGALDRLVIVANQTARFALTTATVQNGDTVKQNDTGLMYYVVDDTNLGNTLGYEIYTAGSATSVPYSGITSLPSNISQLSSITFSTNDLAYYNGSILTNISPTSYKALLSLTKSDVGLNNLTNSLQVINSGGVVSYASGNNSAKPTAGTANRFYAATDIGVVYRDNGATWDAQLPAYTGDVTSTFGNSVLTLATVNSNVGTFNNVTVNAKGLVTAASNVSYLTGNQTITASGDITGSGTTSIALTLATVNSNVGTFGSTTVVPVITTNAKGLITSVSTAALTNASVGLGNVSNNLQVINSGGVVSYASGNNASKPTAGTANRFYAATDIGVVYRDNGVTWDAQLPAYTGDVTSTFGNSVLTLATVNSNVGTFNNVTVNAKGLVTAASNVAYITGNQTITVSGDITGSGTTTLSLTLPNVNSNVGTFNNVNVNAKGQVIAATNVAYITGNQSITLSGDFSGTGTTSISGTLATVNSNVGSFGSTTVVPVITVNGKGLVTAVSSANLTSSSVGLGNVSNSLQVINAGGAVSYAIGTNASRPTFGTVGRQYYSTDLGITFYDTGTSWVAKLPAYTGDVTSSVNGTALTLATVNSNVGTFNNVTVNGKGLVTAASNVSYLTGNQSITLSGDFSGTGTTSISGTLATVNSNVGTFGSTTVVPVVTVNGKGLVTAVSTAALTNASVGLGNVANSLQVINTGNVVSIASGLDSAKPVAGTLGRYYNSTDIGGIYRDNGVAWQLQSIAYTGDVTSSVNGTVLTLATVNSNVGTFNNVTVNGKGLVTAASNVAYITGNQTITVTGDITGSGTTSIGLTLATVNSNVGTFGSTTVVPVITTNAKGLITAVSSANLTNASVGLGNVSNNLQVINAGNGVSFASGTLAARPVAATNGRLYATTNDGIYLDNGASWILQSPAYTGDVTKSANATALTLATVNSNVGTFNNVTINAKGLATSASNVDYLLDPAANGIVVRTAINTTTNRTLTGTANQTSITNGDGVAGNPTIAIASNPVLPGTASTTIPIGTTAERDTATNGQLRFNSTLGYAETSSNNVYHPLGKVIQFISGDIIQTTGTTILPHDATLPTSTEGFQIWTANITPTYTTSTIVVIFNVYAECSVATATSTLALYNGTTAISIAAGRGVTSNTAMDLSISKRFVSGTISPITLSARIGPSAAATVYVNRGNTETFGGTTNSSYIIMEII